MQAVTGGGFVNDKTTPQAVTLLAHTHDMIAFTTAPGEGQVLVSAVFVVPDGYTVAGAQLNALVLQDKPAAPVTYPFSAALIASTLAAATLAASRGAAPQEAVSFVYDRPVVTSISTANNPCVGINDDDTRDAVASPNKTYFGDGTANIVCLRARNAPTATPFAGDIVTIRGANFGSGLSTISINFELPQYRALLGGALVPDPNLTATIIGCVQATGLGIPIYSSDGLLVCQVAYAAPLEFAVMRLTTAFVTQDSRTGFPDSWQLRFACAEGLFAASDGAQCQDCYTGALCVGNDAPPVALPGFWKTIAAEWESAMYLDPAQAGAAPFVPCPLGIACGANNTCSTAGNVGVMCTSCLPGFANSATTTCQPCVNSNANYIMTAVIFLAVLVGGVVLIRGAMGRRSKTTIIFKMVVNFLQMISALRVFLSANDAPSLTQQIISAAGVANYVNLEFSAFVCATSFDYYNSFAMYMLIPPGAALVPAVLLFSVALLRRALGGKRVDVRKIGPPSRASACCSSLRRTRS